MKNFPDMTIDRQAFQVACNELPNAPLSQVLARAQELKEVLTAVRPRDTFPCTVNGSESVIGLIDEV